MFQDRQEILNLAKEFTKLAGKNKLWYVVDCGTLLGAIRNHNMIPWDDDFDVMMTADSFNKLKTLYPNRIIDTDTEGYPLLIPKFMKNKEDFLLSAVFIDIFILVPTTRYRVYEFRSLRNKMRFALQTSHSKWEPFNWSSKIFKFLTKPLKGHFRPMTYQEAQKILTEGNNYEGFYTIDNPIDPFKINFQLKISGKRQEWQFDDFKVYVPIEYHNILVNKYGPNYMIPNPKAHPIEHTNAISIRKVKR